MTLLPIHIAAGAIAIASGAVALYAAKGGKVHRKSGMVFVCSMVAMTLVAAVLGALKDQRFNAMQGVLTFYLVATSLMTVRYKAKGFHPLGVGAMVLGLGIAIYDFSLGFEVMQWPRKAIRGVPVGMVFFFASVALLAALGDLRMMMAKEIPFSHRISRHLWRMTFALWISVASFFLGQAKMLPDALRILPVMVTPVLLVLVLLVYWFVRVRFTKWRPRVDPTRRATLQAESVTPV